MDNCNSYSIKKNEKMKNYSIQIDYKNKLIHYQHHGEIRLSDIGQAWEEFLSLKEFTSKKYNLFSDYRNSKFIGKNEDIEHICKILEPLRPILDGKRQALLLDSPTNMALSMLFEGEINNRTGFIVRVFSTEEAAFKWLLE